MKKTVEEHRAKFIKEHPDYYKKYREATRNGVRHSVGKRTKTLDPNYYKNYREKNKEKIKAYDREWRKKNRELIELYKAEQKKKTGDVK